MIITPVFLAHAMRCDQSQKLPRFQISRREKKKTGHWRYLMYFEKSYKGLLLIAWHMWRYANYVNKKICGCTGDLPQQDDVNIEKWLRSVTSPYAFVVSFPITDDPSISSWMQHLYSYTHVYSASPHAHRFLDAPTLFHAQISLFSYFFFFPRFMLFFLFPSPSRSPF